MKNHIAKLEKLAQPGEGFQVKKKEYQIQAHPTNTADPRKDWQWEIHAKIQMFSERPVNQIRTLEEFKGQINEVIERIKAATHNVKY